MNNVNSNSLNKSYKLGVFETHSTGGVLLQLDEFRDEFTALTGDETEGLPDFTDPASFEGLDDFIIGKVNKLLDDVYSE